MTLTRFLANMITVRNISRHPIVVQLNFLELRTVVIAPGTIRMFSKDDLDSFVSHPLSAYLDVNDCIPSLYVEEEVCWQKEGF